MRKPTTSLCLTLLVFLGSAGESFALPQCPGSYNSNTWNGCVGTTILLEGVTPVNAGDRYTGEWKNGKPHGQGTVVGIIKNRDFEYVGDWKDGKGHGQGTLTGTYTPDNGEVVRYEYVGEFRDDNFHKGTETQVLGNGEVYVYVGEFKDWNYNGQGKFTFPDGTVKEGIWENGNFLYAEKLTTTDEELSVSAGQDSSLPACESDEKVWDNCFGIQTYRSGNKYVGEWRKNRQHGKGTYIYISDYDTEPKKGIWHENLFLGDFGTDEVISTDVYLGTWTQKEDVCAGDQMRFLHRQSSNTVFADNYSRQSKHSLSINNGIIVVEADGGFVNAFRVLSDNEMKMVYAKLKEYNSWTERRVGYGGWFGPIYYRCSD